MSLGSSKPATSTTNYITSNDMPEEYKPYFENMMTKAEALSNTPYQAYGGQRFANKDPNTIASRSMIQNIATSGNQGIDEATAMNRDVAKGIDSLIGKDPYNFSAYDYKAPDMYSDTGGAYQYSKPTDYNNTSGAFQYGDPSTYNNTGSAYQFTKPTDYNNTSSAYQFTKPTDYNNTSSAYQFTGYDFAKPEEFTGDNVSKYMSPYMQNVVDVQKAKAAKEYQAANQARAASAISAGAFGGSRSGVQQAIAENDLLSRNNEIQALGLQNAFDSATGLFEKDRAAKAGYDISRAGDLRALQNAQSAENINNRNFGYDVFKENRDATSRFDVNQAAENINNRNFGYDAFRGNQDAASKFDVNQAGENDINRKFDYGVFADAQAAKFKRDQAQAGENDINRKFDYGIFNDKRDAISKYDTSQAGENDINRKFGYDAFTGNRAASTEFQKMLADEKARIQNSQSAENRLTNNFDLGALKDKSDIASQIADLSERARTGDLQAAQLLGALGADQEADTQRGLDLEYQNFLDQRANPRQQLSDYASILHGLPISNIGTTTGSQSSTSTAAQPSGIQQLLGAGTAALGLYKGFVP